MPSLLRNTMVGLSGFVGVLLLIAAAPAEDVGLRIRFGLNDENPTRWNGGASVSEGKVTHVSGWRFTGGDHVEGDAAWVAGTHPLARRGRSNNPARAGGRNAQGPVNDNGVMLSLSGVNEKTQVSIKTMQGEFQFAVGDVLYGQIVEKLDGAVEVERTGTAERLSPRRTDDDYPAAAVSADGTVYVAYVSYTPTGNRDDYNKVESEGGATFTGGRGWKKSPEDFSFLADRPGGDRVWLHVQRGGKWSKPIAVTEGGADIYKCAVTVDGAGNALVFWSENLSWPEHLEPSKQQPNFEIFARSYADGKFTEPVNLSKNAGNDVNPAATVDASGRAWLTWQAVRDGAFRIVERHQLAGGKWSEERRVSTQSRNCWTPAVAASHDGKVAIAWDTYEKGDYDVWMREFSANGGSPGAARPVSNSVDYEARPSLTYDAAGALWVAFELGSPTWGKNFGALVQNQGLPLYRGRQIGLLVWKNDKWQEPVESYVGSLPGARPRRRVNNRRVPAIEPGAESPAQARAAELMRDLAYNNMAKIAADRSGHIWLFCRSRQNDFRFPVLGSLWLSWVSYYDGKTWTGPILLPNSDNLIYNLPAVVATPDGGLLAAHATDHRQERFPVRNPATPAGPDEAWTVPGDPFDNDIYISRLEAPGEPVKELTLKAAKYPPAETAAPIEATVAEREAIARCRDQQIIVGGEKLKLIRGEFHRHTEISGDGGNDGPLEDMWRYSIDVAGMDWLGCSDHDNGAGREYPWWLTQKTTDAFRIPGLFEPPYAYERSVRYPEGHRNVVFEKRGIRTLPRLPITDRNNEIHAPDTQMLYRYLHYFDGVCASHTSATRMGTDWRDNDPIVEPMVEIYQGDRQNYERPGAPRCPTEEYSIGGWEPKGFVNLALLKGYRLAFECSSDHISTHISYSMVYAESNSPADLVKAMRRRHVYGSTDNIVADYRCTAGGVEHMLGDEFTSSKPPTFGIKLHGTAPFAKVTLVKNDVEIPLEIEEKAELKLSWTDPSPKAGKTSYYYVRGEQTDGELVWLSPMWIKYQPGAAASGK